MTSEEEKQTASKGFSGLSSLVSDVDSAVANAKQESARPSGADAESVPASAEEPDVEHQPNWSATSQPPDVSSTGKWLLGIAAVIGMLWLFSTGSEDNNTPPPDKPRVAPVTSARTPLQIPSPPVKDPFADLVVQEQVPVQAPSRPTEERPPVGTDNVLNHAQLRYCLSEDIRIGEARTTVNSYSESDVDRFNAMVNDYNSRCGQFRYRRGSLESVKSDVERNRSTLVAEGRSRFARSPSAEVRSTPAESSYRKIEASRDQENLETCISGEYPSLCNHSLLTRDEALQVVAAEKRANFRTCISGEYPSLCNHTLLTRDEAVQVEVAERKANFRTCISGEYPSLCNHSHLTIQEAVQVDVAEKKANFRTCISGAYPSLCNHTLLTRDEAVRVAEAERRMGSR